MPWSIRGLTRGQESSTNEGGVDVLIGILLLLVLLAPYPSGAATKTAVPLPIAYSSISGAAVVTWLAVNKGLFAKNNLDVNLIYVAGSQAMPVAAQRHHSDRHPGHRAGISSERAWQRHGDDSGHGDQAALFDYRASRDQGLPRTQGQTHGHHSLWFVNGYASPLVAGKMGIQA
jgi:hypothetical protein